jgi:3'-phosphoadenosine 5'-phosphosulfate (PAPS) 3'-phosphatase
MKNLMNVSVADFKANFNCNTFSVISNPKTQKLFVATDNGKTFRCQQDIDVNAPVNFIGEDMENLCLVNIGRGVKPIATF